MKPKFLICTIVVALLACSIPVNTGAQEIYMGRTQKFSLRNGMFDVVGKIGDRIYTYRSTDNDYFLDAYNDTMSLMATIALDFFPKRVDKVTFVNYADKIIVIYRVEEKGSIILYGAVLDSKGLIQGRPKQLDSEKLAWLSSSENYYETAFSEDRSKLVVVSKGGSRKDSEFKLLVFDDQLNNLSTNKIRIDDSKIGDKVALDYMLVSNNGTVIIPTFSTINNGSIDFASLVRIDINNPRYINIRFGADKKYFNDFILKVDNKSNICHVAALYKNSRGGNIQGTYVAELPLQDNAWSKESYNEYPEKFLKSITEKDWKEAMNNYKLEEIIIKQDGGYILVGESQYFTVRNYYSGGYWGYNTFYGGPGFSNNVKEYRYGDITIMNYDPSGVLMWSEHIRKNQYSQDDGGLFSSFGFLNSGASLVFLFNNTGSADNSVAVAAIDNAGVLQLTRLNQLKRRNEWLMRVAKQIDKRNIVIPILDDSDLTFAKVSFD